MTKKFFLIISIIFALFLCSSTVFAMTDTMRTGVNNAGNEMKSSWDKIGNTVGNAGNAVANGFSTMGQAVENTMSGNGTKMSTTNDTGNYTAARTSTDTNFFGMSNTTMWTWVILAVFGVAVVALVWYYGLQNNNDNAKHLD